MTMARRVIYSPRMLAFPIQLPCQRTSQLTNFGNQCTGHAMWLRCAEQKRHAITTSACGLNALQWLTRVCRPATLRRCARIVKRACGRTSASGTTTNHICLFLLWTGIVAFVIQSVLWTMAPTAFAMEDQTQRMQLKQNGNPQVWRIHLKIGRVIVPCPADRAPSVLRAFNMRMAGFSHANGTDGK